MHADNELQARRSESPAKVEGKARIEHMAALFGNGFSHNDTDNQGISLIFLKGCSKDKVSSSKFKKDP